MTKKEWNLLRVGDRVKVQGQQWDETKEKLIPVIWFATIEKFHLDGSHVLIHYEIGTTPFAWKDKSEIDLL
jgi:hypothetical protein